MPPLIFLEIMIVLAAAGLVVHNFIRRRFGQRLRAFADEIQMRYAAHDAFGLSTRIQRMFPVPGASDVRVTDLIYRTERDCYRYFFTAEYTQGVVGAKSRVRRAGLFTELIESPSTPLKGAATIRLADERKPLLEQYKSLL